jgi:hypothetical protein
MTLYYCQYLNDSSVPGNFLVSLALNHLSSHPFTLGMVKTSEEEERKEEQLFRQSLNPFFSKRKIVLPQLSHIIIFLLLPISQ